MSIYGHNQVEIDQSDTDLHWKVFAVGGSSPVCIVPFMLIYDISQIYKSIDHLNALAACLCNCGFPDEEIRNEIVKKFGVSKIHPICFQIMTSGGWSSAKSKKNAHSLLSTDFADWQEVDIKQVNWLEKNLQFGIGGYTAVKQRTKEQEKKKVIDELSTKGTEILIVNPPKKKPRTKVKIQEDNIDDEYDDELDPIEYTSVKEKVGRIRRKLML